MKQGGHNDRAVMDKVEEVSRSGGTPLVVADGMRMLGVIHLKDVVKGGIKERFAQLRKMGIRTVMITGDNQLTAAAIAAEAGRGRFHRPSQTRRQARPHPARASRWQAHRDDRRRHK